MSYVLLIVEDPAQRATRSEAEGRAAYASMQRFGEALVAEGKLKAVESLGSQRGAARVSRAGGRPQVVDGPFTEVKEMVGGFFLLDGVSSREEAIAIAQRCPAAEWATVEVRSLAPCFDDSLD